MEFWRQFWQNTVQTWRQLSVSARVNIGVTALITLVLIVALVAVGSRAKYVNLFTNLSAEDTAAIQAYLTDEGIPYSSKSGGQTLLVPVQHRQTIIVELAGRGLPKSQGTVPGFELFDKQNLMESQSLQKLKYQRAVNGELQKMLNQFDFVKASYVFISEAEEELFTEEQKPSKAAVTLSVTRQPTQKEIRALLNVIATFGGANLDVNHITLATTTGVPLWEPPTDELTAFANSKADYIKKWETDRERRVKEIFAELGKKAIVRVSAKMDFRKTKETSTEISEGAPIARQEENSTSTTTESLPEGPAGATANRPQGAESAETPKTSEKRDMTVENFDPSRRTLESQSEPGDVTGYAVSVILEGNYQPATDESGATTGENTYVALTDDEKKKWRSVIANAVGVKVNPETDIIVEDQPFQIEQLAQVQEAAKETAVSTALAYWSEKGIMALQVALLIVAFLLVRRYLLRAFRRLPEEVEEEEISIEAPQPTTEELRKREIVAEVERAFQEQPDAVAALLRSWLAESED